MKVDLTLATYMYKSSLAPAPARPAAPVAPKPGAALPGSTGDRS